MPKIIVFTLAAIRYDGALIGSDVRVEVDILGKTAIYETKLKKGDRVTPNLQLGSISGEQKPLTLVATIRVIEGDVLFPDKGQVTAKLKIDPNGALPQHFTHTIAVRESRGFLTKRTARFEITIEANTKSQLQVSYKGKSIAWWESWKKLRLYTYRGVSGKEDYNRYDSIIQKVVARWNKEFCDDRYPPDEPLDPNLVKAMIYIESRMGYFQSSDYPAYPDVMQIADSRNPAIHTLNNDGWKNEKGVRARESEWSMGSISTLDYRGKANGASPKESILWGARWLYHRAQGVTLQNTRYWRQWRKAVTLYNGYGNETYAKEVYDVYRHGIDRRSPKNIIQLFSLTFFLLVFSLATIGASAFVRKEKLASPDVLRGAVPQAVHTMMSDKLKAYERQDSYYYGDLFRDPARLCRQHENECFAEHIFSKYIPDILARSRSIRAFLEAVEPLDLINASNSFFDDFDNDGSAEFLAVMTDYLNHEHLEIIVVDEKGDSLHVARTRIPKQYNGGAPRILDLTGDAIPEIVVFSSGGRQDIQVYAYQYIQGELKQVLSLERNYLRSDIIFTDQNHNYLPEIRIKGERFGDECMACDHEKIDESFEYNLRTGQFKQI